MSIKTTDYEKYRGKCKQFVDQAVKGDPTLIPVRGYYHCPFWGKQQHWWCKRPDGSIYDPTVKQFPTAGVGAEYEEFDGYVECAECGKRVREEEAGFHGRYAFCSISCNMRFVGL